MNNGTEKHNMKCPQNWNPGCSCSPISLEPNENCYVHGWPDIRQCPFCGQFRGYKPCKRCGCDSHIEHLGQTSMKRDEGKGMIVTITKEEHARFYELLSEAKKTKTGAEINIDGPSVISRKPNLEAINDFREFVFDLSKKYKFDPEQTAITKDSLTFEADRYWDKKHP